MISRSKKNNNRQNIIKGDGNERPEEVLPTRLRDIPITTPLYTAEDVDKIISQLIVVGRNGIIIPDQEIAGDYYLITMRSGRLTVVKVDPPDD